MTEWIDFSVYAAVMLAVWFGLPAMNRHFIVPLVTDRNPDWLAAHPGAVRTDHRLFQWSCFALGALSLAVLIWAMLEARPQQWMLLRDINTASVIVALLYFFGCALLFERWLRRAVPLATRRHATLERRTANDLVPRGLRLAIYAVVLLHLAVWLGVGLSGRYSTAAFWGTLAFQFAISAIFLLIAHGTVTRRPNATDRIFGPGYRRTEARVAFVAQLIPLLNGTARLYEEVSGGIPDEVNRMLHLAVVTIVVMLFVRYALLSRRTGATVDRLGASPMTGSVS